MLERTIPMLLSMEWRRGLAKVTPPFFFLDDSEKKEEYSFRVIVCELSGKDLVFLPNAVQSDYVVFYIKNKRGDNCVTSYWYPIREGLSAGRINVYDLAKHLIHKIRMDVEQTDLLSGGYDFLHKGEEQAQDKAVDGQHL